MKNFHIFDGDVTSPKGFQASGVHIGIKKKKKDMALIVSDVLAEGAGVFTRNQVCAAPVLISKENIKKGKVQAIIINSGNANACTGKEGHKNALKMLELTAEELKLSSENVLVASTGVIGVPLPMDIVERGIKNAAKALSYGGGIAAAEGILTTDTGTKKIGVEVEIDGKKVTIGGIAKGSGMIHPNMATMLAFITTDAKIEGGFLQSLLKNTVDKTYNMITVDGDTSTNDSVCMMANGLADNNILQEAHPEIEKFKEAFHYVNEYLAKTIVRDGEGATKFLEVEVVNSKTFEDGKAIVKSILNSNLVKTAFFGEDGNWGRIMCSIGYADSAIEVEKVEIYLGDEKKTIKIVEKGEGTKFTEEEIGEVLKEKELKVVVDLKMGNEKARGWGCDLSYDYVKINGAYRT
ncbi:bifunctional glutamate N-acetyltransferase/amino-acid acetyltransferase ArgJ [Natronincola ferrireducens]|uniref:Arginine biosynthesis bifunctional protein ArgJ n=1 Tax=Natronincola ferrireducens TaxID=393762 RepID=A0A1G8YV78_9FIRM|nr:bifunctional glutamate N-acetyltransferase/amino-acid acetyltransferase ArgJ [Natronincola ferrireducens]SDK06762.1 glutamate N-acetyltransferase [Natronincola ferrireducens]